MRLLPFLDLRGYRASSFSRDLAAGLAVLFVAVPQGMAYAIIAGLPPATGLYAAALPAIVGSLFRSSRHVVTGPTNALSLLVGAAVAVHAIGNVSPLEVAIALALVVGVIQLSAGVLGLGVLVDYVSHPVLRGYITGAAVLIAVGQLPNATGTVGGPGNLWQMLAAWARGVGEIGLLPVVLSIGTAVVILVLRRLDRRLPAAILVVAAGIALASLVDLEARGVRLLRDLAPIPQGLPRLSIPSLELAASMLPAAVACTVLSLIESTSSARAIAARSGQRLVMEAEFTGQGLANLAAAFFSGYPVSGSLTRSALVERAGAETRLAGAFSGAIMIAVPLVLAPLLDLTPIASLAGLLLVVAVDLVEPRRIREILSGTPSDRAAFIATLAGTWFLPLDRAIYLGVGISLVLYLRRARLLSIRELVIGEKGRFREIEPQMGDVGNPCTAIRIFNLSGPVFFAVSGELESALARRIAERDIDVVILRVRQAQDLDVTAASVLENFAARLAAEGKTLILLGLRLPAIELLERTGIADRIGRENLFPIEPGWFSAMESALRRALALVGPHACGDDCPLEEYLRTQVHGSDVASAS